MVKTRTYCIRCGECCIQSSPTLQAEDLPLVKEGTVPRQNLYAIRKGELVWDNVAEALLVAREEMVKIREREGGSCLYYDHDQRGCRIYGARPAQCSAMACWDPGRFMEVYKKPKLAREDVLENPVLVGLVRAHESKCSYDTMGKHVKRIEKAGDEAVEAIIQMLRFDHSLRPHISRKLGLDPKEMDFLFGRPMIDTVRMFGLKVERTPDGGFYLTALPPRSDGKA